MDYFVLIMLFVQFTYNSFFKFEVKNYILVKEMNFSLIYMDSCYAILKQLFCQKTISDLMQKFCIAYFRRNRYSSYVAHSVFSH